MKKIKEFIRLNTWFYKESKKYMNPMSLKNYLYFPIAWLKFITY
jgi:hypothetical protein